MTLLPILLVLAQQRPLTGLDAFKAFQQGIPERCDEQP